MAERTTFELSDAMAKERDEHAQVVAEAELRRRMKTVVVPTDDAKVRAMLRQLEEPITLFGEREMERRERLRRLIAEQEGAGGVDMPAVGHMVVEQLGAVQTEKFYTEGTPQLQAGRVAIAHWSLRRAAERIARAKRHRDDLDARTEARQRQTDAQWAARHYAQQVSEVGDDRPIAGCDFSPDGSHLATCGWGGALTCWSVSSGCSKAWSVRAHDQRCTGVAWHPSGGKLLANGAAAGMEVDSADNGGSSTVALATASADSTARLFTAKGTALRALSGHTDRLARLAFHPMGHHLATASFDMTWRLWDVESGECLLEQEGHSRAVYAVGFHPDGSLAASAGLDAIGRIWDCRTGRSPFALEGHVKQILCLDFSPSGVQLVTGSDDHTCKVWDLRQRSCVYTIPAHSSLVSSCRFERECGGAYLVTGGYDSLVKVWSGRDFALIKTLAGHEGRVMGVDVCSSVDAAVRPAGSTVGGHLLASVSYDRTLKLWAPEAVPLGLGKQGDGDGAHDMEVATDPVQSLSPD